MKTIKRIHPTLNATGHGAAICLTLLFVSGNANATLIGDKVGCKIETSRPMPPPRSIPKRPKEEEIKLPAPAPAAKLQAAAKSKQAPQPTLRPPPPKTKPAPAPKPLPVPKVGCSSPSAIVGDGSEFGVSGLGLPSFKIDLGSEWIDLFFSGGLFKVSPNNVVTLHNLDWVGMKGKITGLKCQAGTGLTEYCNNISFTANSVSINILNLKNSNNSKVRIGLQTSHEVPEPGTIALLGLGLAGIGIARRRKKA